MPYRLTLIAGASATLSLATTCEVMSLLETLGAVVTDGPIWAAPHRAAWVMLGQALRPDHMATLRLNLAPAQIDVLVMPIGEPKLFMADMDSTMLIGETLDELAAHTGVREQVAALTAKAMNGTMDYREALAARLTLIKGTGPLALRAVLKAQKASPGGATMVATLKSRGVRTVLVSGGFTYFANPIGRTLGFDYVHGNTLDLDAMECVTGQVIEPLIHHAKKLELLHQYVRDMAIISGQAGAIGDGANDIPMLQAAGFAFAYRPKPAVRDVIANQILYGDLTSVLYALGYTPDVFVETLDPIFS